jgi:hypothetical protein
MPETSRVELKQLPLGL